MFYAILYIALLTMALATVLIPFYLIFAWIRFIKVQPLNEVTNDV